MAKVSESCGKKNGNLINKQSSKKIVELFINNDWLSVVHEITIQTPKKLQTSKLESVLYTESIGFGSCLKLMRSTKNLTEMSLAVSRCERWKIQTEL